ncbi:hypothetical protein, partial [Sulfitobacter sp.]|uniref:hypothetical protein n=1 Tax=Sulfitobacter sp. TaxID=1903071 RepID=UPI002622B17B
KTRTSRRDPHQKTFTKAAFRGLSIVAALHSPKLTLSPVPLLLNDGDVRNIFRAYQSAFFCLGGCVLPVN